MILSQQLTIQDLYTAAEFHNGKKIGAKKPIANVDECRRLDAITSLPKKWTMKKGISSSRIEIDEDERVILTPRGSGQTFRVCNTASNGELATVADRPVLWLLCELKCQANKSDDFNFGIFDSQVETDHSISRSTLYRWLIKGIIGKAQLQYLGNCLLMRKSKNAAKNNRSEYGRVDRYFTGEEQREAKIRLNGWFRSSGIRRLRVERQDKNGLAKATAYAKLSLWYQVHQLIGTAFYLNTVGDLRPSEYPTAMVQKFHGDENDRVVNRSSSFVLWLLPS